LIEVGHVERESTDREMRRVLYMVKFQGFARKLEIDR
jgi:hypothetical protein